MSGFIAFPAAAACVAAGALAARRLSLREKMLNDWEGALLRMEGDVTYSGAGLKDVLKAGAEDGNPVLTALIHHMEAAPAATPEALTADLPWDGLLADSERRVLAECLLALFSPSLTRQAQAIAYAREQWAPFRALARKAREGDGKLFISLGWLAGAAMFILLC